MVLVLALLLTFLCSNLYSIQYTNGPEYAAQAVARVAEVEDVPASRGLILDRNGIPLAYDKDMQEDKEAIFDAVDTLELCLRTVTPMLATMTPLPANMRRAAAKGFINATDCADYLTKKGMPFRDAYTVTGHLVAQCTARGKTLEELTLEELKAVSELFEADVYDALNLENCMALRSSYGGPAVAETARQIGEIEQFIQKIKENR